MVVTFEGTSPPHELKVSEVVSKGEEMIEINANNYIRFAGPSLLYRCQADEI